MRNASSPHSVKMIGSEQKSEQERYNTFNISSIKRVTRKFLEASLYSCKTTAKKCTKKACKVVFSLIREKSVPHVQSSFWLIRPPGDQTYW